MDYVASIDWKGKANSLALPAGLFIDGKPASALAGGTHEVISPRDGSCLGSIAWGTAADVDRAVAVARKAFPSWAATHPRDRGRILQHFAALVEEHRDEIALLIAVEMGKPIKDCWGIEVRALINCLRFYGEVADKTCGEVLPTGVGELALVTREPAGVVGAVVPWNFPITLAGWKFAPALAAGCAVVLKTSEFSPLSMLKVAELGVQAGLPAGVLNVVSGEGIEVGAALGLHPDVDVLTFTGSTTVGRHFLHYAADSNLKRVHLELGGKSPNIIFPDAPNLEAAVDTAAWAIFFNTGEMCTAGSRLVVHEDIAEQVVTRLVTVSKQWYPGDPLDPTTKMGPLISRQAMCRIHDQISASVAAGAEVVCGGRSADIGLAGAYLQPTIVTNTDQSQPVVREELFGPVLAVQTFRDEAEAVVLAGDTPYGLAAALWTADLARAHRVSRQLRAGTVWVNCYEEGDMNAPFGGVKLSGNARDKSRHALDEYSDLKTTWIVHD